MIQEVWRSVNQSMRNVDNFQSIQLLIITALTADIQSMVATISFPYMS